MKCIASFFLVFISFICFGGSAVAAGQDTPLSLKDCLELASNASPVVGEAEASLRASQADLQSANKDLLPTLSAGYTYQRQFDNSFASFYPSVSENYFSYNLQVEQPVYRGNSLTTSIAIAKRQVASSSLARAGKMNDLFLNVNQAFYNHLKNRKLQAVAAQAVERLQSHLKDSKAFFEAGLIPKNDLLQSEVQLSQGQLDSLQAENAVQFSAATLNLLLGRTATEPVSLVDRTDEAKPFGQDWQQVLEAALSSRPEIRQARTEVEISDMDKVLAAAPYLPSVSVSASYLKQGNDVFARNYDMSSSEVKQAQASVSWRFWSWRQNDDRAAAAMARKLAAEKRVAQLEDSITLQARNAYLALDRARKNIDVSRSAVQQAEENYRINEARYQAQLNTSTQVLDAQTLLTRANANYFSALYDYAYARAKIDWVIGGSKQQP